MNIALFSDSWFPTKSGIVTVVSQLFDCLEKKGHHVVLVTVSSSYEADNENENIFKVSSIPLGLGTDQNYGFPILYKISKFLEKHSIELIHCHTEFNLGRAAAKAGKHLKIPVLCTTHTMWEDFYRFYIPLGEYIPVQLVRIWQKHFFKKFYALINVSTKAKNYFKQDFMVPEIPSVVIPNAINKSKFQNCEVTEKVKSLVREKYGILLNEKILLFVGRMAGEKRVKELIKICQEILPCNPGWKAVFVGDGPILEEVKEMVINSVVNNQIIFTGFVDWERIQVFYALGDIFMSASLSEMHSMTILEAEMCSLPIVVRDDSSYYDTVIPEKNGYLSFSDEQMAKDLQDLMNNEEKRKKFGNNSFEFSKHFSIENYIDKTEKIYKKVLEVYKIPITDEILEKALS